MDKETAELIVDKIINELNGRRGCGIDSLDEDIQEEIRDSWIKIAMTTKALKKEVIKVINAEAYDDDAVLADNPHEYIKEFIHRDSTDLIEESYGDDLPDRGFDCKLYFLLKGKYYCVDINCTTYWESSWSARKNYIENINIKGISDFNVDEDKVKIKFI
jgi:hypothetical protein